MIRSSHFFAGTPSDDVLRNTVEKCRKFGGEIVKIAAMATSEEDVARVLALYSSIASTNSVAETQRPVELVAFSMGEIGKVSRLDCLKLGSPFTYAALNENEHGTRSMVLFGDAYGCLWRQEASSLQQSSGICRPQRVSPKRAIIAAALAEGESRLGGYSPCGDNKAAIAVAKALGAKVRISEGRSFQVGALRQAQRPTDPVASMVGKLCRTTGLATGGTLILEGIGSSANIPEKINVGESGLLTRLMIPLTAALGNGNQIEIDGIGTLRPGR